MIAETLMKKIQRKEINKNARTSRDLCSFGPNFDCEFINYLEVDSTLSVGPFEDER